MRVHELAKELGISSRELLATLRSLKIAATSHASALNEDAVRRARHASKGTKKAATSKALKAARPAAHKRQEAAKEKTRTPQPAGRKTVKLEVKTQTRAASKTANVAKAALPKQELRAPSIKPAPAPGAVSAEPPPTAEPKPAPQKAEALFVEPPAAAKKQIQLKLPITVKDLATRIDVKPSDLIKWLMERKIFASLVQALDEPTVARIAGSFNFEVLPQPTLEEQLIIDARPDPARSIPRATVVTFMGHVDHGKTSLLDAIREAKVAEKEAGNITQHIGAYEVELGKGRVTFLDTPGHEAFTALRARGANVTDVVVLVVAADDGVMPQTVEAINHAKAAGVTIVVAINKIDRPDANPQKVKQQLTEHGLIAEDWGGKTVMVPVSAKTRQGLDELLELLLLEAELLELKTDPTVPAQGVVIEAKQTKDRGPVATLLVEHGKLHTGETILVGHIVNRIRAMTNDRGHRIKNAGAATPVEILGLSSVPPAGERFIAVKDEKQARELADRRKERSREETLRPKRVTLDELHQQIAEGKLKELRIILKADARGSMEAIVQSLQRLDEDEKEVQFKMLHTGIGDINESDIALAAASDAIIFGFNVGMYPNVQVMAAAEGVDIHTYSIIYDLINALKSAIEGLLEPITEETFVGRAEVRKLFQVSKLGTIGGCMVTKGSVRRDCALRVIRGGKRIRECRISNLKRLKDDVREVQEGTECGIALEGGPELEVGDFLEAWEVKKIARRFGG